MFEGISCQSDREKSINLDRKIEQEILKDYKLEKVYNAFDETCKRRYDPVISQSFRQTMQDHNGVKP